MVGALIDMGNPFIPFIGGILVGGFLVPPIMDAAGGLIGQAFGDGGEESNAVYSYHAFKHKHGGRMPHGGMGGMHGHHGRGMGHKMHGMMPYHGMMPSHPMIPFKGRHRDFEKEYTNIEQTYTNHINVRH